MTRNTARNRINKLLGIHTKGFFDDDFWTPVNKAFAELDKAGFDYVLTGANYEHDANGNPCRKVWTFEVPFGNKPFYGIITAAGAGSVNDPLDRYDVTAYVA
jgi:hypothetical protein